MTAPSEPDRRPGRRGLIEAPFAPPADRRSVLDRAHQGDIIGALGRVPSLDTGPRRSFGRHLATLLAVTGPGLVALAAGNDAGGVSTYAQVGQEYGLRFLWLVVVLAGALLVNQEMVCRLGAVTGAGHARLIYERFGRRWGGFALGDLIAVNFLVIITEFIGVALGLGYFGVSRHVSVPLAAIALVAIPLSGSFRRWERMMYLLVAVTLVAGPLVVLAHHPAGPSRVLAGPHQAAGGAVLVVIALIGTTVAPWQLFFQQSNVVDKRITTRWLAYERVDTGLGALLFALVAVAALVAGAASGAAGHPFVDAGRVASDLRHAAGPWAGALFAVVLLNGSILGAAAVTLSTSYAIGDVTGTRHSLHRGWRDARTFHGTYVATVALAATIMLLPGVPLGIVTTGVQALTGVLLPSALVFLLLLCNDRAVLGPRVNPRWLNVVAGTFVSTFLVFSALLVVSTLFPLVNLGAAATAAVVGPAAAVGAAFGWRLASTGTITPSPGLGIDPLRWTMPPFETLPAPVPTRARQIGLVVLRVYILLAVVALVARIIRLIIVS